MCTVVRPEGTRCKGPPVQSHPSLLLFWQTIFLFAHLCGWEGGVGRKPKIVLKQDPSVANFAWESIFQMNESVTHEKIAQAI